jgi:hypothetical protein
MLFFSTPKGIQKRKKITKKKRRKKERKKKANTILRIERKEK